MQGVWYLENKICLIRNAFLVFRLIWVRSSSIFMRMIFSKLRNATMTAQSKLYVSGSYYPWWKTVYNNICAICVWFAIKLWNAKEILFISLFLLYFRVQAFLSSDQNRCAMKLLSAYEEGDAEEIKRIGQSSAFNHLDHVVILFIFFIKGHASLNCMGNALVLKWLYQKVALFCCMSVQWWTKSQRNRWQNCRF